MLSTREYWVAAMVLALCCPMALGAPPGSIRTNRKWERLPAPSQTEGRDTLEVAAQALSDVDLRLAGVVVRASRLATLSATPCSEPLVRAVRESLGRPVDLEDFLYFLDDLAVVASRIDSAWVHSGRARRAGILIHPDDVFGSRPRRYGGGHLAISPPAKPPDLTPARDGAPLGPRWSARYRNPDDEEAMLAALQAAHPGSFDDRLRDLIGQLRIQGAEAYIFSTVRRRERGYLMYGAFLLSRADTAVELRHDVATLDRLNREWGLNIPIQWTAPDDWHNTVRAARRMAEAYNVVYATRRGARHSAHYGGAAVDFAALDLPRRLTLAAPDGVTRTFDLSDPDEPRDLDLTPRVIGWVERHFGLRKLRSDYPHWTDDPTGR